MFYLEGYLDNHNGKGALEGMDAPLKADLIKALKEFIAYGNLPREKGSEHANDTFRTQRHNELILEVVNSKHTLMYGYSENIGETLLKASVKDRRKRTLAIVSPPFGDSNHLLTYTNAVVVNKHKFVDPQKAAVIKKFVKFYTSLSFRTSIAFGKDLVSPKYPRYVLPALKAFYSEAAASDGYYKELYRVLLEHSIPAPNCGLYSKRHDLQRKLKTSLGIVLAS